MSSMPDSDFGSYLDYDSAPLFLAGSPTSTASEDETMLGPYDSGGDLPFAQSDPDNQALMDKLLLVNDPPVFAKPLYSIDAAPRRPHLNDAFWHYPRRSLDESLNLWSRYAPILNPNPSTSSPPHSKLSFPAAPTYTLLTNDWRFRRGCAYYTPYYMQNKESDRQKILSIVNPPGVSPRFADGKFENTPIDGMIEMPLGIPFGVALEGDLSRWITVACAHSLDSLKTVTDAATFTRIKNLSDRLWDITWGANNRTPIYALPGLERNLRSSKPPPGGGPDGSYNLASTLENRADGYTVPAVQACSSEAKQMIQEALEIISDLYTEIAPNCICNEEWSVTTFRDCDMNVFSIGRPSPGPTSVQSNFSSASKGGGLADFIGKVQGQWHADVHDHHARWTLLILQFRLPPGSDMGAFLLARPGLYVRHEIQPDGQLRLFLFFKGNDLHSGTAPSVDENVKAAFLNELAKVYNSSDEQNRSAFVAYPNAASVDRSVPLAATAPTGLGNDSVLKDGQDASIHNYARDGRPALGNASAHMTRLLWENYARSWNACAQYNVRPSDFNTHVQLFDGTDIEIPPPPLHPIHNYHYIHYMRAAYKRYHLDCDEYYMRIDKTSYHATTDHVLELVRNGPSTISTSTSTSIADDRPTRINDKHQPFTSAPRLPSHKRKRGLNALQEGDSEDEDLDDDEDEQSVGQERRETPRGPQLKVSRRSNTTSEQSSGSSHSKQLAEPTVDETDVLMNDDLEGEETVSDASEDDPDSEKEEYVCEAKDDTDDDDDENDEEEYVISRVIRIENGECWVRWRGYDSDSDSPLPINETPSELVQEYRDSLNPDNRTNLANKMNQTSTTYHALCALLDSNSLLTQSETLETVCHGLQTQKRPASAQFLDFSMLSECPAALQTTTKAVEDAAYEINDGLGLSVLHTLMKVCEIQEQTRRAAGELDVIRRAVQHVSCRSLLFIYHWQSDYGIGLASSLFNLSQEALWSQYPSFAGLTIAIRDFLYKTRDSKSPSMTFSPKATDIPEFLRFPDHPPFSLPIRKVAELKLNKGDEHFLAACGRVFIQFFAINILAVALKGVDERTNGRNNTNMDPAAVYDRCLVRGAVLDCLLDAVDDDGIFCADEIKSVLEAPWMVLNTHHHCIHFAERLKIDPTAHLRDFSRWLKLHPDGVNLQNNAANLGNAVRECLEILGKFSLPKILARRAKQNKSSKPLKTQLVDGETTTVASRDPLSGLYPRRDMPEFGCLGIILVEVLAHLRHDVRRVDTLRIPDLQPVLIGRNPITTLKMEIIPDFFNPCRAHNDMHTLFSERLQGQPLTSEYGLSNILLFIGTGQGGPTTRFVRDHLQQWITSAARCTQIFENARTTFIQEKDAGRRPPPFSNGNCWGTQFCSHLSLMDTNKGKNKGKRVDIAARCEEFFSQKVKAAWENFLSKNPTPMWHVDLSTIGKWNPKKLPTFSEALKLGVACGVGGFGENGLTNLQLANSIALLGLCQQPTIEEMGRQIFRIKKGALGGLRLLGLDAIAATKEECVIDAFRCVYTFMDEHLSDDDKETLGFGTIFVEHFLCKLNRWARLFSKLGTLNKERLKGAIHGVDYYEMGYPLPMYVLDRKTLDEAMYST